MAVNESYDPGWEPVERPRVTQMVAERLISMIRDGAYKPGDQLPSQKDLIAKLKVSRSTVREALSGLAMLGYVEVHAGEGFYVREMQPGEALDLSMVSALVTDDTIRSLYEGRAIIDTELAALAAVRATEEDLEELRAHVEESERYPVLMTPEALAHSFGFHRVVAEAAHNPILAQVERTLLELCVNAIPRLFNEAPEADQYLASHRTLLDAIEARDPAATRKAAFDDLFIFGREFRLTAPVPPEP